MPGGFTPPEYHGDLGDWKRKKKKKDPLASGGATYTGTSPDGYQPPPANGGPEVSSKPFTPPPAGATAPGDLTSDQQNALVIMQGILAEYGLESLSSVILDYIKQGYGADAINVLIQQTPEWKQRFAGNELRSKAGLAPLSPAEYLSTEAQYQQILRAYGMPASFYDSPDDYAKWIGENISPDEIQTRAEEAATYVNSRDPGALQALAEEGIDPSQIAAYFLDTSRAMPMLQQTYNAIGIGTAAADNGLKLSSDRAHQFASMGVTGTQARQAYSQIAQTLPGAKTLSDIYHVHFGQEDLENELLGGDGREAAIRQGLARREEANFSGSGGVGVNQQGGALAGSTEGAY